MVSLPSGRRPVVGSPVPTDSFTEALGDAILDEELPLDPAQQEEVDQVLSISSSGYPQSVSSRKGYTLDSTLIVNTRVVTVRALVEAGIIEPVMANITEGTGLAAHTATDYRANFTDRNRSFAITEETYRAIVEMVEPHNEAPEEEGLERIQTNMEPITADRQSSLEQAVDGHGRTKPYRDDTRFPARTPSILTES